MPHSFADIANFDLYIYIHIMNDFRCLKWYFYYNLEFYMMSDLNTIHKIILIIILIILTGLPHC